MPHFQGSRNDPAGKRRNDLRTSTDVPERFEPIRGRNSDTPNRCARENRRRSNLAVDSIVPTADWIAAPTGGRPASAARSLADPIRTDLPAGRPVPDRRPAREGLCGSIDRGTGPTSSGFAGIGVFVRGARLVGCRGSPTARGCASGCPDVGRISSPTPIGPDRVGPDGVGLAGSAHRHGHPAREAGPDGLEGRATGTRPCCTGCGARIHGLVGLLRERLSPRILHPRIVPDRGFRVCWNG